MEGDSGSTTARTALGSVNAILHQKRSITEKVHQISEGAKISKGYAGKGQKQRAEVAGHMRGTHSRAAPEVLQGEMMPMLRGGERRSSRARRKM